MADDDIDDDNEVPEAPSGPSVIKWSVAGGLAIFLGVLGAQVLAPFLIEVLTPDPNAPDEEMLADGDAATAEVAAPAEDDTDLTDLDPAIYVPLEPPLLASFEADDGSTRYLQMSIQAMGRDQDEMDAVRQHAPAIRNAFLFLMSKYTYDQVATAEGKEELRSKMLEAAQEILRRNTGEPGIEEIYFTSLVLQ